MPFRFINIDVTYLLLNTTSAGMLVLAWLTEHMASLGGFFVMFTVGILNLSKAYVNYKKANK